MKQLRFSLYKYADEIKDPEKHTGSDLNVPSHNAIWIAPAKEELSQGLVGAGKGFYLSNEDLIDGANNLVGALRFEVTHDQGAVSSYEGCQVLVSSVFAWPNEEVVFRLDQITFPSQAMAYRHLHSGAGFRHLILGGLEIDTGEHKEDMRIGSTWFEDVGSPVCATAISGAVTQFIRCMIIPIEFEGKPTINFLNAEDFEKPKLQKNHRFFDQRILL